MFCERCRVLFRSRALYILHLTKCKAEDGSESEEFSEAEDSDVDPLWQPENGASCEESVYDFESQSTTLTIEQEKLSSTTEQEKLSSTTERLLLNPFSPIGAPRTSNYLIREGQPVKSPKKINDGLFPAANSGADHFWQPESGVSCAELIFDFDFQSIPLTTQQEILSSTTDLRLLDPLSQVMIPKTSSHLTHEGQPVKSPKKTNDGLSPAGDSDADYFWQPESDVSCAKPIFDFESQSTPLITKPEKLSSTTEQLSLHPFSPVQTDANEVTSMKKMYERKTSLPIGQPQLSVDLASSQVQAARLPVSAAPLHVDSTPLEVDQELPLDPGGGAQHPVTISSCSTFPNGKRVWNKKDCCIYCEQLVTNFTRHLTRVHKNEIEVAKILTKPKGNKDRKLMFEKLRKKGNFFHNTKCINDNSGSIIVKHRSKSFLPVSKFLPCRYCFGFYSRSRLYRHMKICPDGVCDHSSNHAQSVGSTMLVSNQGASEELKSHVLQIMKNDVVTDVVKRDTLICEFGSRMLKKHKEPHYKTLVSCKMRELARLQLKLNEKRNGQLDLSEFLRPEYYEEVVSAIKDLAGYSKESGTFKTPSLATKLGHSLKSCSEILECRGIISTNQSLEQSARQFNYVMSKQWQFDISSNATRTLQENKLNNPQALPLAEDIKLLHQFLLNKGKELASCLKENITEILWRELCEVTLVHVITFNRRRAGEASRIKLIQYTKRNTSSHRAEVENTLSVTEKALCNSLVRFEIRGKTGRSVPVILTPVMKSNFDLLIATRSTVGVHEDNPYMFAIPKSKFSYIRGSATCQKYAKLSGAKSPNLLTSTNFRKHVATMAQLLNLSKNDLEQLAKYLGHNLDIHKEYYRLPENTWQVAKVSKLLLLMEKGKLDKIDESTLENINIDGPLSDDNNSDMEKELQHKDTELDLDDPIPKDVLKQNIPEKSIESLQCTGINTEFNNILQEEDFNNVSEAQTELAIESTQRRVSKRRKTCIKKPWSEEEKNAVKRHFHKHILMGKVPNKAECDKCLDKEPVLKKRTWSHIKFCVKNLFSKQTLF